MGVFMPVCVCLCAYACVRVCVSACLHEYVWVCCGGFGILEWVCFFCVRVRVCCFFFNFFNGLDSGALECWCSVVILG